MGPLAPCAVVEEAGGIALEPKARDRLVWRTVKRTGRRSAGAYILAGWIHHDPSPGRVLQGQRVCTHASSSTCCRRMLLLNVAKSEAAAATDACGGRWCPRLEVTPCCRPAVPVVAPERLPPCCCPS